KLAAMVIAESPAERVVGKLRFKWRESRGKIANGKNCLRRPHLLRSLFGEEAAVAIYKLSVVQLQLHPLRHVGGAGVDCSRRTCVIEIFKRNWLQLSIDARVWIRIVAAGLVLGRADGGMFHPQRCEDSLANVIVPTGSSHRRDDLPRSHVQQI